MMRRAALKPSKGKPPTAAEKRHFDRVGQMGCLVCNSDAELHHVSGYADRIGRISRSHQRVVPLCPSHHRIGAPCGFALSVEALGHRGFYREYGIDLLAEAERLWAESEALEKRAA
jgi:hypothetical protein